MSEIPDLNSGTSVAREGVSPYKVYMTRSRRRTKRAKSQRGGSCPCSAGAGAGAGASADAPTPPATGTLFGGNKRRRKKITKRRKRRIMRGGSFGMSDFMGTNIQTSSAVGGCTSNQCFS